MSCINIFAYDVRGTGESRLPVAPLYQNGKKGIGRLLGQDLLKLYWEIRDYSQSEDPECYLKAWSLAGHSLGAWLSIYAAVYAHTHRLILFDPPFLPVNHAARWVLACQFNQRHVHPLSMMTRRRKRTFRNAKQAAWVFSKLDFFKGWSEEMLFEYVHANYKDHPQGLVLRHNPSWEADVIESQPISSTMELLMLPKKSREQLRVTCLFGADSPFNSLTSRLLLMSAFRRPEFHEVKNAGHMLIFQEEEAVIDTLHSSVLQDSFFGMTG